MSQDYMVKVVDVHKENIQTIWPCLMHTIKSASFIAIDCELSGLGDRRLINAQAIDERYKHIGSVAQTRSIISMGLCCFRSDNLHDQVTSKEQGSSIHYEVQTFNIMALCAEEYVVEPSALQFLVNHDFDFQKQYSKGVPYHRGSLVGKTREDESNIKWNLRDFFDALVLARVPIVLHNGLVDLVFMYHNLYASLPASLSSFLADLDMMFPSGIFDTKYIAEFEMRMNASFLEHVFRACQLHNLEVKHKKRMYIQCSHTIPDSEYTVVWDCSPKLQEIAGSTEICEDYSNYGHCKNGNVCLQSHDVFRAVIEEKEKRARKRRRRNQEESEQQFDPLPHFDQTPSQERFKGHRAGHDAFMTGFSFASFLSRRMQAKKGSKEAVLIDHLKDARNRICLSGKNFPMLIQKSAFSKYSKGHLEKYAQLVPKTSET